jgi:hypothetical protein
MQYARQVPVSAEFGVGRTDGTSMAALAKFCLSNPFETQQCAFLFLLLLRKSSLCLIALAATGSQLVYMLIEQFCVALGPCRDVAK